MATVLIGLALMLLLARLLFPLLGEYRENFGSLMSDYLGVPVHVEGLHLSWQGHGPLLIVDGLTLLDPASGRARFRIQQGSIRLGLARPFWQLRYRIRDLSLDGVPLRLAGQPGQGLRLVGFGEPVAAPEAAAQAGEVGFSNELGWLLETERLRLRNSFIELRRGDAVERLSGVDLSIVNEGDRHRLSLQAALPGEVGAKMHLLADLRGPPGRIELWDGEIFVNLQQLALPQVQRLFNAGSLPALSQGRLDLLVWSRWQAMQAQAFEAELKIDDLAFDEPSDPRSLRRLEALLRGQRGTDGWRIDSHRLRMIDGESRPWSTRRLLFEQAGTAGAAATWRVAADAVELEHIGRWIDRMPGLGDARQWWRRLQPGGRLHQPWVEFGPAGLLAAGARGEDLAVSAFEAIPAVSGLDAVVHWRGQTLDVDLDSETLQLDFGRLFRDPIELQRLRGRLAVHFDAAGLRLQSPLLVASSEHLRTRSRLRLELPERGPAFIDMQSKLIGGDVAQKSLYLPAGIMFPPLVEWLDRALLGGRIVDGGMILHGPLPAFPFARHEGVFAVDFQVRDASLRYRPDWPALSALDADVRFYGPSLSVDAESAVMSGAKLKRTTAVIRDLTQPVVEISGAASGEIDAYVDFIHSSPLQSFLGPFFASAEGEGVAGLTASLRIPLFGEEFVSVAGQVDFDGQSLNVAEFDLDIKDMHGQLEFTESSIRIDAAEAIVRGSPTRVHAETVDLAAGAVTRFLAEGRFNARQLLPRSPFPLESWFPGSSEWQIGIELPAATGADAIGLKINAVSELQGTALAMPRPLAKTLESARRLSVSSQFTGDGRQFLDLSYAPGLRAVVELRSDASETWIERAAVTGDNRLPSLPPVGVTVSGRFGRVDYGDWLEFVATIPGGGERPPLWHSITDLDLQFERLEFGRPWIDDVRISGQVRDRYLALKFEGQQSAGTFEWPFDPVRMPARLRLGRLDLTDLLNAEPEAPNAGQAGEAALDPRNFPALDVVIERLRWNAAEVEGVDLQTTSRFDGLQLQRLSFGDEILTVDGRGHWVVFLRGPRDQPVQRSLLELNLKSQALDAALRRLDYADALREGKGTLAAHLVWDGSLFQPPLSTMRGKVAIDFEDGRLISVDPGMGRIFGLLSLQALPRRLSLDFKDFLTDGFSYDRIHGTLRLRAGDAYTEDLSMSGPAATVNVTGRTGLIARDYDQQVIVRPHLASSLPVVSALAAGPATGLAVFLVERVISGLGLKVEDIGKVTYTLGGTWDQPKVEKVINKQENIPMLDLDDR